MPRVMDMTGMTAEKWVRFQKWRMKLAARVVETGAGRLFDSILMQEPVWTDYMAFQSMVYTFFRIYLSLPEQERKKYDDLARELREIIES